MPLRSYTEAEVLVTKRRRFERLLTVQIWLGIAGFSLAEGSTFYLLAGTLAAGLIFLAAGHAREVYVRRALVNVGVLAATAIVLLEVIFGYQPLLIALGHYLILIQLCKLFDRRTNRDYVQLLTLSLLQMVAGAIICDELWFAAILSVYAVLACYTGMLFTLKRGLDRAVAAQLAGEAGPLAPQRVAWNVMRDWPRRPLRGRLMVVLAAVGLTGAAMFLVVPRGRAFAALSRGLPGPSAQSGYAGSVQLGNARTVRLSQRVVMRVKLAGDLSDRAARYLRGRTFSSYASSRWSPANPAWTGRRRLLAPPSMIPGRCIVQEIETAPHLLPRGFAIYPAVRVEADAGRPAINPDREIAWPRRPAGRRKGGKWTRYTVHSWAQPLTARQRAHLAATRRGPDGIEPGMDVSPRVMALARQWCRDLLGERDAHPDRRDELDLAIARRIERRLRAEYEYSLDLSAADPDRDGVEDFLFHMKQGHCEYFASALTVMCHALGVRARLVAGFYIDPDSQVGGTCQVRQCDAHAWTEVFTPSSDWVVADATPGGPPGESGGWWASVVRWWKGARLLWHQEVIGYDAASQQHLGRRLKSWYERTRNALAGVGRDVKDGLFNLLVHGYVDRALLRFTIVIGLAGLVAEALVVLHLLRGAARGRRQRRDRFGANWKRMEFMSRLVRLIERRGVRRRPHQTMREFVRAAAPALGLPDRRLDDLVRLYYRLRWGRATTALDEVLAAEREVAELTRTLSG